MSGKFASPSLILVVYLFSSSAIAQTVLSVVALNSSPSALSQNSGINPTDTWVTLDLTAQTQNATMTLASPVYNPATGTVSNIISPTPSPIPYHIEAGYDTQGGFVMNLWPNGTPSNPSTTGTSVIRYAGGQVTVFDQNGNPLQESLPPGVSSSQNLLSGLLGSNPAPALLSSLVMPISGLRPRAAAMRASLTLSSDSTSASMAVPVSSGVPAALSYARFGSYMVAKQMSIPVSQTNFTATRTMQFANVTFSQNYANDVARAAKVSPTGTVGSTLLPLSSVATNLIAAQPAVPADQAATANAYTISNPNCKTVHTNLQGSQNIALTHGYGSDACAWTRMANWINQDFLFNNEIIPNMGDATNPATGTQFSPFQSYSYLDTGQAQELIYDINLYKGNNYILAGHSQGGLVSRSAAQQLQGTINPAKGVITIDTPNLGANVASNLSGGLSAVFNLSARQISCDFSFDCFLKTLLLGGVGDALEAKGPSFIQDEPGSQFLTNLNAQPEYFQQAAIVGLTDQRWAFTRMIANFALKCNPEDGSCGERAIVNDVEIAYDVMEAADDITSIWCFDLCNIGAPFASDTSFLDSLDSTYNNLIDGPNDTTSTIETTSTGTIIPVDTTYSNQSDAFIQASSQFYPNSNAMNYVIPHADSHTGALLSDKVHPQLDNALNQFKVPTQTSCTFGLPSLNDSFSSSAVYTSISLTTGPGCQWSAVSQSPWITVTPTNGISKSAINLTVAVNPSNIPRSGSINIGNGSSIQTISISQGGPCAYSLSPPEMFTQPTGGVGTVTVTTAMNCPWSAVSNTPSWLTVSAGAGGIGTGSFTWAASPNTGVGDRIGIINVMGTTLTVIDGSPVGTPAQGWVAIQGYPESVTFNPCPPQVGNCPQTIQEAGAVAVIIAGQSFSVGYGNATAQQLASSLAGQINGTAGVPVIATASGAMISLQSTINGSAASIPISTAFGFGPNCAQTGGAMPCFNSPAFTAVASGSQLTGGTD